MDGVVRSCDGEGNFLHQFNKKAANLRLPVSGSINITNRCNLRCVHCYLDPKHINRDQIQNELNTEEIKSIVDEIAQAGCLYLLITGGEPLVRKDFAEIYRYVKSKGIIVTLFTNGTLLSDKFLDLFNDFPPRVIEISLYGAIANTYEKITGVQGSYERCIAGIEQLMDRGLNLRLKTVLMTINRHEFAEMEQMAKYYGVRFRFDAALFPRFNGDLFPLKLRVSPEEAVDKEFSERSRRDEWHKFYDHFQDVPSTDAMYQCGAGLTYFHIDAYGNLQPCLMNVNHQVSLRESSFLDAWNGKIRQVREKKLSANHVCVDCSKRVLCGYCPPFFQLETNSDSAISNFMCSLGQLRYERLNATSDRRVK
jgi:radical SAM protein with 4Fe4S-binding SPASM domain